MSSLALGLCLAALAAMAVTPALAAPEPGTVAYRIAEAKAADADFQAIDVFAGGISLDRAVLENDRRQKAAEVLAEGTVLRLLPGALRSLQARPPAHMTFELPYDASETGMLRLDLVKVNIFADGFTVRTSSPEADTDYDLGVHYRGVVRGDDASLVAVSFFRGEVMGLVDSDSLGEMVLGRLGNEGPGGEHLLYASRDLKGLETPTCAMDSAAGSDPFAQRVEKASHSFGTHSAAPVKIDRGLDVSTKYSGDCVEIYFETDYNVYQDKGSASGVITFVTGFFNQVATLYSNESIETAISEIFVWNNSGDPYTSSDSGITLSQFQNYRTTFNGDLGQVLKIGNGSGVAAGFYGLCNASRAASQSASMIFNNYSTVPTYSHTVFLVAHELGHLFGSRHTHACVWNGNNTAIDGCSGYTELGTCPLPGYPAGGGTIMSYCSNTYVGVDFSKGFGPQPGNAIRGSVSSATCLAASCGGGGGWSQTVDDSAAYLGGPLQWWWQVYGLGINGQMHYTYSEPSSGTNFVYWYFDVPENGYYEVEVHIPNNYATTQNALYYVHNGSAWVGPYSVNQNIYYDEWVTLTGSIYLPAGQRIVYVGDVTGEPSGATRVGVDAARMTQN